MPINLSHPFDTASMSNDQLYSLIDELTARRRHPSHARLRGVLDARLGELRTESTKRFAVMSRMFYMS